MILKAEAENSCADSVIPYLKSWAWSLSYFSVNLSKLWHLSLAKRTTVIPGYGRYLLFLFILFGVKGVTFFLYVTSFYPFFLLQSSSFPSENHLQPPGSVHMLWIKLTPTLAPRVCLWSIYMSNQSMPFPWPNNLPR